MLTTAILILAAALASAPQARPQASPASTQANLPAAPGPTELQPARELANSGRATEAEASVRQFLQAHTDSSDGHFLLGYILFREIQEKAGAKNEIHDEADADMAKFRDAHARASLAEFTLGAKYARPSEYDLKIVAMDYILLDDSADADKWLTQAVTWNPGDADAWYNLARTKYTENRFDEAIQAFEECLKLEPKNEKAEYNLGLSYQGLGRADDAQAAYKTAIEWDSSAAAKDPEAYNDLGILYLEQNRPKDALPYLQEAVAIAPFDAKGHETLGKAYSQLERLPEAQKELEKAVGLAPDVASLHYVLGQVYRKLGMIDKAKAEFARTAALNGAHSSDKKTME